MDRNPQNSFQDMILALHDFWSSKGGCLILQPYDMRMGAGTFHTATTLRAGAGAVERRLRPAVPPPHRRALWRESQ